MTLEQKIAECNTYPEPLKAFITGRGEPLNGSPIVTMSVSYLADAFQRTTQIMAYTAERLKLDWLERESIRPLHPIIIKMLNEHECDWYGIMLEWPHVAEDGERLAYTRNVAAGVNDRQTVTSLGKYLARHWPDLPDHTRRDAAALFTPDKFEMLTTTEDIVRGVQEGPNSCMRWDDHDEDDAHPYSCYTPQNGWTLAVRISGGRIDGRCLCHTNGQKKIFVRSFARDISNTDGYSHSDTKLEAWLKDQGYQHKSSWSSYCQLDTASRLFPYIDGSVQNCDDAGFIREDGEHCCDNTDGTVGRNESADDIGCCDRCDRTVYESDDRRIWADSNEQTLICSNCAENYNYVTGCNQREYYVHDNASISVNDTNYDINYLDDNGIVKLENSDYAMEDDCVCIDGDWYLEADDDVVYFAGAYHLISDSSTVELEEPNNGDRYAHSDDTWTCAGTCGTYHDNTPHILIDGEKYHESSKEAKNLAEFMAKQTELELAIS